MSSHDFADPDDSWERRGRTLALPQHLADPESGRRQHRPHSHDVEDELFYVLEGEVRSTTGDIEAVVTQGGTVSLPKQQAHQFQVLSDLPAAPGLTTKFAS